MAEQNVRNDEVALSGKEQSAEKKKTENEVPLSGKEQSAEEEKPENEVTLQGKEQAAKKRFPSFRPGEVQWGDGLFEDEALRLIFNLCGDNTAAAINFAAESFGYGLSWVSETVRENKENADFEKKAEEEKVEKVNKSLSIKDASKESNEAQKDDERKAKESKEGSNKKKSLRSQIAEKIKKIDARRKENKKVRDAEKVNNDARKRIKDAQKDKGQTK